MKTTPFHLFTICATFTLLLFLTVTTSHADDFNTTANFNANDTSTVAPGDSQEITLIDEFWGLDWDEQWARGNYALADGDPSTNVVNDYRFSIDTHGRVGLYTGASFNYGTMDVNAPLDINMHTSQEGNTTTVNTDYSILAGAGFSTSGATGNIDVNFVTDAYFRYMAKVAVAGVYTTWDGTYNSNLNVYPLINQDQDDPPFSDSFLGGLIDVTAQIPNVTAAGTVTQASGLTGAISSSSRTASSSETDSILDVSADIGKAISAATGVPLSVGLDLYNNATDIGFDFDATLFGGALGAEASLSQNFEVTMNPGIHLEFDRPVLFQDEMGWTSVTQITATLGNSINFISSDIVHATTTYTMNWQITNNTDIDIDTYLDLVAGDFEATIGWGIGHRTFDPDPLYSDHFETQLAAISVYDERWRISGQDIAGDSFYLNLDSDLAGMLANAVGNVTPESISARGTLGAIILDRNSTPTGDETPDLLTENSDLYWYLADNIDTDGSHVDALGSAARWSLYDLLASYDTDSDNSDFIPSDADFSGYFDFILDDSIELGIDFQPIFDEEDDDLVIGLFANFYSLDYIYTSCPSTATSCEPSIEIYTLLSDLDLDNLLNTSFAFFYSDLAGITDLTIYQNSAEDRGLFSYAYSSLEQYVDPVPEPATILLLGGGLAGLAFYRRKRK